MLFQTALSSLFAFADEVLLLGVAANDTFNWLALALVFAELVVNVCVDALVWPASAWVAELFVVSVDAFCTVVSALATVPIPKKRVVPNSTEATPMESFRRLQWGTRLASASILFLRLLRETIISLLNKSLN